MNIMEYEKPVLLDIKAKSYGAICFAGTVAQGNCQAGTTNDGGQCHAGTTAATGECTAGTTASSTSLCSAGGGGIAG
jgi:hypothetical protein